MGWGYSTLNKIFDSTSGYCYYCGKKIAWKNYGKLGERGCWEVDHFHPQSSGGSNLIDNLVPACIPCNRDKGTLSGDEYLEYFEPETQTDWIKVGAYVIGGAIILGLIKNHLDQRR